MLRIKKVRRFFQNSNGQVAIIAALLIVAIIGMTALVVDMGSLYEDRRSLQGVADAAALAGAQELPESTSAAAQAAIDNIEKNYSDNNGNLLVNIQFDSFLGADNAMIKVTVTNPASPIRFGSVYGTNSSEVGATATAIVASPAGLSDLVPWAAVLEEGESLDDWLDGNVTKTIKKAAPGSFKMGNFLALNLSGEQGGGATQYVDNIIHGYDGIRYVGEEIYPQTGNIATTRDATLTRIANGGGWDTWDNLTETAEDGAVTLRKKNGQFCMVPVIYEEDFPPGSSNKVTIVAFAPFIIVDINPLHPPGQANIIGRFVTRALLVTEGKLEVVSSTGFRVIRLIK